MQQRIPSLLPRPILFAHRGARAHAAENTIEAFDLALRLGATGLQTDVRVTADGVAVLDHDGQVRLGRFSKRPIRDLTRDELPSHIPTLLDLFEACGTDYDLALALEDATSGPVVVEVIRRHDPELLSRTWLCHGDLDRLVELRVLDERPRLIETTRRLREAPELHAARLARHGIDGIELPASEWSGGLVTMFHRFELVAFARDVQHEHELVTAIRMGADAVFSDHVDRMSDAARRELT